jgi:drug/metabolite transporter (DMT)-like permease
MWLYMGGSGLNFSVFAWRSLFSNYQEPGLFSGYDGWGIGVLICNSLIGIAITAVYKVCLLFNLAMQYGDAIIKCFAQSTSTAILLVISYLFFGLELRVVTILGCLLIFVSTFLYMNPGFFTAANKEVDKRIENCEGVSKPVSKRLSKPITATILASITIILLGMLSSLNSFAKDSEIGVSEQSSASYKLDSVFPVVSSPDAVYNLAIVLIGQVINKVLIFRLDLFLWKNFIPVWRRIY